MSAGPSNRANRIRCDRAILLRFLNRLAPAALALAMGPALVRAQSVDPNLYVTNGSVSSSVVLGNTLYIGGQFTEVGPATGAGVPTAAATGAPAAGFPKIAGASVAAVVPDGSGGWYIAGTFTHVGGVPRNNAAHIRADFTVDAWDPSPNPGVNVMIVDGSTVYLAGAFTTVGGQSRAGIAAVDAVTGLTTPWNPGVVGGVVNAMALDGSVIYAGGTFTTIGGQTRSRIAALDVASGLATTWNPAANSTVNVLEASGSLVYVGGAFTTIGGQPRSRIAAIDAAGLVTAWNPVSNGTVSALAVDGAVVYAGGSFTNIGLQARNRIAALDATTGLATGWNPDADLAVSKLVASGSVVYAGGSFFTIGGQPRSRAAALDAVTGAATVWNPAPSGAVRTLAVSGTTVFAGGSFGSMNAQPRLSLASIDLTSGVVTGWNPGANGTVMALATDGNAIYAGGLFVFVGGQPRNRIAAIDPITGVPNAWNPNSNNTVNALVVDGSLIYAGGSFASIGGQTRDRLAALDITSGAATAWNPAADNTVNALAVSGSTVYAGGVFTNVGGQARFRIAAIEAATGLVRPWNPDADNAVNALAVSGSVVYAGGSFTVMGGVPRSRLAAIDTTLGLTPWNPGADNTVNALVTEGLVLYAGGSFANVGGQPRARLAAILPTGTGTMLGWSPTVATVGVSTLALSPTHVLAGGNFTTMSGLPQANVAAISRHPDPVFTIMATATAGGQISPSGAVSVVQEANRGFSITPDSGFLIEDVLVDGASVGPESHYAFFSVNSNHTIHAVFASNSATATLSAGPGGNIDPSGEVSVQKGSYFTFTVTPDAGYLVDQVTVNGSLTGVSPGVPAAVFVSHDVVIAATFKLITYTIQASSGGGGSIDPVGAASVDHGTDRTFTITPAPGFYIRLVRVDGVSVGRVSYYTFTNVTSAHQIVAGFGRVILASAGPGGSISPVDSLFVTSSPSQTYTITPDSCYAIADVIVDGVSLGAVPSYTFLPLITANHTISASFTRPAPFRDDFDGSLQPGWTIVRETPSSWSLTGDALRIESDYGDLWLWTNNSRNLFLRPAPTGDFQIEARLDVDLVGNINQAHILLYGDDDNYLRFGPVREGGLRLDHVHEVSGGIAEQYAAAWSSNSVHLQIERVGNSAVMRYSANGTAWTDLGTVAALNFAPRYVGLVAFDGSEPPSSSVASYDYFSISAPSCGPTTSNVAGFVTAACGAGTSALYGVTVDLFTTDDQNFDVLVASTATDSLGGYAFPDLAAGNYTVSVVTPLGYQTVQSFRALMLPGDAAGPVSFAMACTPIIAQPRGMGYWKHQVNVHLTGRGTAQEPLAAMLGYVAQLVAHFNENIVNPVIIYQPVSGTTDQLLQLRQLLTLNKGATALDRAKQHLLALLLNVVSGKISQTEVISNNGATVSMAITHAHDLIVDGITINDETAKNIAEAINEGRRVPPDLIPADTRLITYDRKPVPPGLERPVVLDLGPISPNPATLDATITFALPTDAPASLEVVDLAGRMVSRLAVGSRGVGVHTLQLAEISGLRPGVYLVRLTQGRESLIKRLAVIR